MSAGMVAMQDGNAKPTLYDDLRAAGLDPQQASAWSSDLHVRDSEKAREILERHGKRILLFVAQTDGKLWLEVPFAWAPFWRKRA